MIKIRSVFRRKKRYEAYGSLTRADRVQNMLSLVLMLMVLGALHTWGMVWFEGLSGADALWLTMTTMTTVGYGDFSATTAGGRLVTILLMYVVGIFLLAQIAGEWIDYRLDRRERMRKGLWRWNMKDHIVIINTPDKDGSRYMQVLVEQIRNSTSLDDHPILVLSPNYPDGLPNSLTSLGVVLRHGEPEGRTSLEEVDVETAAFIIVLAENTSDYRSDSLTLDILDQLKEYDLPGYVIAECVQDENRARLRKHGAHAVLRPVRAYPELMVRAMAAPGTETILEDMFQHHGVHSKRYDVDIAEQPWGHLAARLLEAGFGTPLGYINLDDEIITNPKASSSVTGKALFVLVDHENIPNLAEVQRCVSALTTAG